MSRPTRVQVENAIIEADEYMAEHRVTEAWRVISRLHATLVRLTDSEPSTGDAEAEAITEVTPKTVQQQADLIETWAHDHPLREAALDLLTQQPRETVTTAEELDALPVGSVVLDPSARPHEKQEVPPDGFGIPIGWFRAGSAFYTLRVPLPAAVIYRPEETP